MNGVFGDWVSSFITFCYGYVSGEVICPFVCFKSDSPAASTAFVANSRFVPAI